MKMFLKDDLMVIYFFNPDKTIFRACITDENIERVVTGVKDSSRYFTLKVITQEGTTSYVGLGNLSFVYDL
jgi:hypothetical protein